MTESKHQAVFQSLIGARQTHIAPSLLAADFTQLGAQAQAVLQAGAKILHLDVMDGRFVPPISFGSLLVKALRSKLGEDPFLDVHLMVTEPERHLEDFAESGASAITIHAEATRHVHRCLQRIREFGCVAGLAVCPATPVAIYGELLGCYDFALCMTVNPGWGGQRLIPQALEKVRRLVELHADAGTPIEVDGGICVETVPAAIAAGANWLVAGTAVYNAVASPADSYAKLRQLVA